MKILAIDTSSMVASAAVMDDQKLLAEHIVNHKRTHSEQLMPIIERVLESCDVKVRDLDAIAVASGPGSFTGLRIGAATAKGLAHACGIKIVGVPTLDGLAFNLSFCQGIICPIMDARRNQVYTALYKWEGGSLFKLMPHCAIALNELLEDLKKREERVVFLGDGVPVHRKTIQRALGDRAGFAPKSAGRQRASSIAELALQALERGEGQNAETFVPFYLRKSQAEREYDRKAKPGGGL